MTREIEHFEEVKKKQDAAKRNAIIEECASVVENWPHPIHEHQRPELVAAIRALKH